MQNFTDLNLDSQANFGSLVDQVAFDLASYLGQYPNKSFAIRILSKETGLNEKTLKRLLNRENKPTYQTLFKLYSIFLEEECFQKLLAKSPEVVRSYLAQYTPEEKKSSTQDEQDLLDLFKKEPLAAEIFVLAGTAPLIKSAIGFRYGQYGLEVIELLLSKNILIQSDKDVYNLSAKVPNLDGEALKFLGEYFVQRFAKVRDVMSENMISFFAEGLNQAGKEAWLEIDTKAFYKKVEIANDPKFKGPLPYFTFTVTDSIIREKS